MSIVHVQPPVGNATENQWPEPKAALVGISPCGCHVQLQDQRGKTQAYTVEVLPTSWPGVAVRMMKVQSGEHYEIFAALNGQDHLCDCKGFTHWGNRSLCKHLAFVLHAWTMEFLPGMRGTTLHVEDHPAQDDPIPCVRCGLPVEDPFSAECDACTLKAHAAHNPFRRFADFAWSPPSQRLTWPTVAS